MPGIVLTLTKKHTNTLIKLYALINMKLKNDVISLDKVPHISLMRIQRNFDQKTLETIENVVKTINVEHVPLKIKSIGMFKKNDNTYVLFLNPVHDINLKKIHKKVWDLLSNDMNLLEKDYYSPNSFTPHITIPIKYPSRTVILKVCNVLLMHDIELQFEFDKISFINTSKKTGQQKLGFK